MRDPFAKFRLGQNRRQLSKRAPGGDPTRENLGQRPFKAGKISDALVGTTQQTVSNEKEETSILTKTLQGFYEKIPTDYITFFQRLWRVPLTASVTETYNVFKYKVAQNQTLIVRTVLNEEFVDCLAVVDVPLMKVIS